MNLQANFREEIVESDAVSKNSVKELEVELCKITYYYMTIKKNPKLNTHDSRGWKPQ